MICKPQDLRGVVRWRCPESGKQQGPAHPVTVILAAACLFVGATQAYGVGVSMKGPPAPVAIPAAGENLETSAVRLAFLGAIEFYRKRISPISSPRCGFYPSCSAFGHQAVREHGAILGVMMTGDRLTRCNIFKDAGPDYLPLPSGRLFDPVYSNLLSER